MQAGMWRGPSGDAVVGDNNYRGIKYDVKMLPEILKEAGYATAMSGKWHLGYNPRELPNARGFDDFYGFHGGAHTYALKADDPKLFHNEKQYCEDAHGTDYYTQKAMKQIRANVESGKPFFQYLAYNAPHGPLYTHGPSKSTTWRGAVYSAKTEWVSKVYGRRGIVDPAWLDYIAIIEHMDDCIGKVLALLKELKVDDNTVVVFLSDNGAITLEDEGKYPGNNAHLRGQKGQTYQGGINVPCIIRFPKKFPAGMVSNDITVYPDIFPTILELAGLPVPAMNGKNQVRGISLVQHILSGGKTAMPERTVFFELTGKIGVRQGPWKLVGMVIENRGNYAATAEQLQTVDMELYHLKEDPSETKDLRTQMPELYEKLKDEAIRFFKGIDTDYDTQ